MLGMFVLQKSPCRSLDLPFSFLAQVCLPLCSGSLAPIQLLVGCLAVPGPLTQPSHHNPCGLRIFIWLWVCSIGNRYPFADNKLEGKFLLFTLILCVYMYVRVYLCIYTYILCLCVCVCKCYCMYVWRSQDNFTSQFCPLCGSWESIMYAW